MTTATPFLPVSVPTGGDTDDGEPTDIGPGDAAVFPRGWTGTWQIHQTIRKVYVIF